MSSLTTLSSPATPRPMLIRFRWPVLGAGVLAICFIAWLWWGRNSPDQSNASLSTAASWFDVSTRSFELTVSATGELEARNKIELKSRVEGQTTIVTIVAEGSSVKAGDELVKLADDQIRERIEQELLSVEQARAEAIAAENNLTIKRNEQDSETSASKVKLELAELELAQWEQGSVIQERRKNQVEIEKATRNLERSERDLELSKALLEERFISQSEYDDLVIKVIEDKAALDTAKLNAEVYEQFVHPKDQRTKQSALEQAKAELNRVTSRTASEVERARADLENRQRALKIREDRLAKLREQLEFTSIKAPQDGIVVYASSVGQWFRRREPISQGRAVSLNESILFLPDTREMVAAIKVHESLLSQVKVEMPTTVTIDAQPQEPLQGRVLAIAVTPEDGGWMNPDLREYIVRIELPADSEGVRRLKPGMRCTGVIMIGRVDDALAIPVHAVQTDGEVRFVYVQKSAGKVHRQPISLGRSNETLVEITQGLTLGDRILLRQPRSDELAD